MYDPDDRPCHSIELARENAPVIGKCPYDDCEGDVKDYGSTVQCTDCGAQWTDEEAFKASVSAGKQ